jgi:ribosome-associated protein
LAFLPARFNIDGGYMSSTTEEAVSPSSSASLRRVTVGKTAQTAPMAASRQMTAQAGSQNELLNKPRSLKSRKPLVSGKALADLVAKAALEHKVLSPVLLNLTGLSSIADWFFIASAENSRAVRAVADKIVRRALEAGVKPLGLEGLNQGESHWALLDLGDVVVHIFMPDTRALYDLESLWADAPRVEQPNAVKA